VCFLPDLILCGGRIGCGGEEGGKGESGEKRKAKRKETENCIAWPAGQFLSSRQAPDPDPRTDQRRGKKRGGGKKRKKRGRGDILSPAFGPTSPTTCASLCSKRPIRREKKNKSQRKKRRRRRKKYIVAAIVRNLPNASGESASKGLLRPTAFSQYYTRAGLGRKGEKRKYPQKKKRKEGISPPRTTPLWTSLSPSFLRLRGELNVPKKGRKGNEREKEERKMP